MIGQDPSASKPNRLHVDIFGFSFLNWGVLWYEMTPNYQMAVERCLKPIRVVGNSILSGEIFFVLDSRKKTYINGPN